MTKLTDLHPEAKQFSQPLAQKIAVRGNKRLRESGMEVFQGANPVLVRPEEVDVGDLLGVGCFSHVFAIETIRQKDLEGNPNLVLKVLQPKLIAKAAVFARCATDLVREGLVLTKLSHPNILSCFAYSPGGVSAFASGKHDAFFLVLERVELTVREKLEEWKGEAKKRQSAFSIFHSKEKRMESTLLERVRIICSLARALRYLHSQCVIHRDLKPNNLGLTANGCLKVFDLETCRMLPPEAREDSDATFKFTRRVGSLRYMSPEVACGNQYNAKSDVYSFGLLTHELLSLKKPFVDTDPSQFDQLVFVEGERPQCPKRWPVEVQSLVTSCWDGDPRCRLTMETALSILESDLDLMCPASVTKTNQHIPDLDHESISHRSDDSTSSVPICN